MASHYIIYHIVINETPSDNPFGTFHRFQGILREWYPDLIDRGIYTSRIFDWYTITDNDFLTQVAPFDNMIQL